MDLFVPDMNLCFMLGSIIPKSEEVEFGSMKIPEIVLTEQTQQVACWAQMLESSRNPRSWLSSGSLDIAASALVNTKLCSLPPGERGRSMGGSGASGLRQGLWGHTLGFCIPASSASSQAVYLAMCASVFPSITCHSNSAVHPSVAIHIK